MTKDLINIPKMCSNTISGRDYAFMIKDNKLYFWKNNKAVKVYDDSLTGEDKNWVSYSIFTTKGLPNEFIFLKDGDEADAPDNLFTKNHDFNYEEKVYLHLTDSSNYLEGVDFYLINISKNSWHGHLFVYTYPEVGDTEELFISETIKFSGCK